MDERGWLDTREKGEAAGILSESRLVCAAASQAATAWAPRLTRSLAAESCTDGAAVSLICGKLVSWLLLACRVGKEELACELCKGEPQGVGSLEVWSSYVEASSEALASTDTGESEGSGSSEGNAGREVL